MLPSCTWFFDLHRKPSEGLDFSDDSCVLMARKAQKSLRTSSEKLRPSLNEMVAPEANLDK
jgi:hypothetical protein